MLQGSLVALVTPMQESGAIDWDKFEQLLNFHVDNGTDGIVAVGTTGESATLAMSEHCEAIRFVVEKINGRIPVVAGTGANSTTEAIELTRCAKEAGADACLLVTPYYNKPTQEGLYLHYKAIAEAVDIPQILYNVPGRTAVDMLPETVARLSVIDNIIGIKEATGDLKRASQIASVCAEDFLLFSGDDATGMAFMLQGGHGVISVTNNVAPKLMSELCVAAKAGHSEEAEKINARLDPLHNALFSESNPIPVKWALYKMGLIPKGIRLPLTVLSEENYDILIKAMVHAGILEV
ncbi:MAG: 4-hydroxy-tetrahydrodipicolinate synthase [Methylococcales bacterium]|jgi:4-hydroxy-tetrahydrodipicolinate synthase|nr:4-hydroxy-tetrahydrodipicolinate synthase [Methylococcales bacterium]MBT7443100.1 4-hydroxy-tetrahydrodipicolinate synthase [Methylococcales bacterium]